ncbi:MAG TPA: nicotinamidase [Burkholderiales bacterium]|jgi:nicotinamidase/pyrazinamidase|nr:nicotinamidase [Burkholderiales bacterium]
MTIDLTIGDALLLVDVQNDFLPGGALGVPDGDAVIAPLNGYLQAAARRQLLIFASRDWHPRNHCSFKPQGGPWPEHCIADTPGAQFSPALALPANAITISKATRPERDAYSAFDGTWLRALLTQANVDRVLIGGLATDYCVLNSVRDALAAGFRVVLLTDAIRAIDAGDGARAEAQMIQLGAVPAQLSDIEA